MAEKTITVERQLADALRLIACTHWDEDLGDLSGLEEEDQKWLGAADWHAGDLGERGFLRSVEYPSGEYSTALTTAGDRFLKETMALAVRIAQPELFELPQPSTDSQGEGR